MIPDSSSKNEKVTLNAQNDKLEIAKTVPADQEVAAATQAKI